MSKSIRDASKNNVTFDGKLTTDLLGVSALIRIAEATELMSRRYGDLERNADYYRQLASDRYQRIERLERRLRGQRAATTRHSNRITELEQALRRLTAKGEEE